MYAHDLYVFVLCRILKMHAGEWPTWRDGGKDITRCERCGDFITK